MIRRLVTVLPVAAAVAAVLAGASPAGKDPDLTAYYPDLRTVVPLQLGIQNQQQREILRFSNGIANTGGGPWAMRPDPPPELATTMTTAVQQIRDSGAQFECGTQPKGTTDCYHVLKEIPTGNFVFHPEHNHWHIGDVALFEVHKGSQTGPIVGSNSVKVTFCLIDWYALEGNAATSERTFWDCATSFQGISVGWVDQYHQSTEGQQLDLTGVPLADDYYLVSTSNYAHTFVEQNYDNNAAWVKFRLYRDSNGNKKVEVVDHSPCDTAALCGIGAPNR